MLINLTQTVAAAIPASTVVFGTTLGLTHGLYAPLPRPAAAEQATIQDAIWGVKAGDYTLAPAVQTIARKYGTVLAGCTEIPLLLGEMPSYDPATILKAHLTGPIIIIGGMGLEAGRQFAATVGTELVTNNAPPCRIAALTGTGPSPAHAIAATIKDAWGSWGHRPTVMACHTAHLFYNEIKEISYA